MRKAYQELFDRVHASERLRTEARNIMKNAERGNTKHRIPTAALLAAALVIALAGTALAAEHFGWLHSIRPVEPDELYNSNTQSGYQTEMVYDKIPAENLAEAALNWIASVPGTEDRPFDSRSFDTWQDAESFLGLKLADNALLEGMGMKDSSFGHGGIYTSGPCLVITEGLTGLTEVLSRYQDGEYEIMQTALLQFACSEQEERPAAISLRTEGMGSFRTETCQTSSGLEAVLLIEEGAADANTSIYASFLQGGTLFKICVDGSSFEGTMEEVKLVLDAYG